MASARNPFNLVILDACRNNPFARQWSTYRNGSENKGLVNSNPPRGTLVLYATEPGSVASDGQGKNSPFTSSLLKQIKKPNLELESLIKMVARDVDAETSGRQMPWKEGLYSGDFYFAGEIIQADPRAEINSLNNSTPDIKRSSGKIAFINPPEFGIDKQTLSSYLNGLNQSDLVLFDVAAWAKKDLVLAVDEKLDLTNVLRNSYNNRTKPILNIPVSRISVINTLAFDDKNSGIKEYTNAMNMLEAEFKPVNTELQSMVAKYQALGNEIQNLQKNTGSNAPGDQNTIQAKIDEYGRLEREIKYKQEDAKAKFESRRTMILGPVLQNIGKAMQEFSKQKKHSMIFDIAKMAEADIILALDEKADVTKDFISNYNALQDGYPITSASASNIDPSRIGVISTLAFDNENSGIKKYTNAMKKLDSEFTPDNTELQSMVAKYENLKKEIQTLENQPNANGSTYQTKKDEYGKLERDIKFKQEDAKARFDSRRAALLGPVMQDIGKAIQEFIKQKGYTMILDLAKMTEADIFLKTPPEADATREFIAFYNKR
jgi:Skp family chaperone for outer membrane proteins